MVCYRLCEKGQLRWKEAAEEDGIYFGKQAVNVHIPGGFLIEPGQG
jgi:hypothetical protein